MKNIYLVGFMGTGKTVVGKALAEKLGLGFVDLDEQIEKKDGRRIKDIFLQSGEAFFRKLEKDAVYEVSKQKGLVVACGGGAVIDSDNVSRLKRSGLIICLAASVTQILKRTAANKNRPLLNVKDAKSRIQLLLRQRKPFYAKADYTVDTSRLTVSAVTEKISEIIKQESQK